MTTSTIRKPDDWPLRLNGSAFYRLPPDDERITLSRRDEPDRFPKEIGTVPGRSPSLTDVFNSLDCGAGGWLVLGIIDSETTPVSE